MVRYTTLNPKTRGRMFAKVFKSEKVASAFTQSSGTPLSLLRRQSLFETMRSQFTRRKITVPATGKVYGDDLIEGFIITAEHGRKLLEDNIPSYDPDTIATEAVIAFAKEILSARSAKTTT